MVIGTVNGGGEVLSDGDIHVYGALHGRALAGLGSEGLGSSSARIFTSSFKASLVGIHECFIVPDDFPQLASKVVGKAVSVHLDEEGADGTVCVPCDSAGKKKYMVFTVLGI